MYSKRNSKWDSALFRTCAFWNQCFGNMTHMKRNSIMRALVLILTMWTRWEEPEEALPKQRTKWENNSAFFYHPCYFQAGKVLLCQLWGHPQQPQCRQPQLVWGQKPSSWYLQHLHDTRNLYSLWWQRKVLGIISPLPPPPEELGHIPPTALRGLEMDEDTHIKIHL